MSYIKGVYRFSAILNKKKLLPVAGFLSFFIIQDISKASSEFCSNQKRVVEDTFLSINANKIESKKLEQIKLAGDVSISNGNFTISSRTANFDKIKNEINAENLKFSFSNPFLLGSAEKFSVKDSINYLNNATFTSCPNNNDWEINASEFIIDKKSNKVNVRNAQLNFLGLPIFFFPEMEWPIEGRGSGFLAPSFSTYKDSNSGALGIFTSIPYYFNIKKNSDLLLNLNNLSTRGLMIESNYRHLLTDEDYFDKAYFDLKFSFLNKDKHSKNNRWEIDSNFDFNIDSSTDIKFKNHRVSDPNYFDDIESESSPNSPLVSFFKFSQKKTSHDLTLFLEKNQVINKTNPSYTLFPELELNGKLDLNKNTSAGYSFNFSDFKHKDPLKLEGKRMHSTLKLEKNISHKDLNINPSLSIFQTNYSLSNRTKPSRTLANINVSIENRNFYNNYYKFGDIDYLFYPKFMYNFTTKENQSSLPLFDSEHSGFDSFSLFNNDSFSGVDRISSDNSITLGINNTFYNSKTGKELIGVSVSQKYFLNEEVMDINGNYTTQDNYSNLFFDFYHRNDQFTLNSNNEYSLKNNTMERSDLFINTEFRTKGFLELGYIYDKERSILANFSTKLNPSIKLLSSYNKSLTSGLLNRSLIGIEYENCCWGIRLAKYKKHTGNNIYDDSIGFEFVLKGLGSSSSKIKNIIKNEIPNYNSFE